MKAVERRFQLLVTIEVLTIEGDDFDLQVDGIRERIIQQVAGHRTKMRLADYCQVSWFKMLSEMTRELP